MKSTIFQIKLVHTVIFWMLSLCVFHALWSGIADRITIWTGCAVALLLVESLVLWRFDWKCPLTILAERRGALRGSVADMSYRSGSRTGPFRSAAPFSASP